jgi:H+-transporting ATPase
MPLAPPLVPAVVNAPGKESPVGLTGDEARRQSEKFGLNSMPDTSSHPARNAIEKLWAPIPWMLEAAIVLELILGKYVEAGIIAVLLLFNAALGFFQEGRAQATLAALKKRLAMTASILRDGVWKNHPASDLVPGDIVKLSLGGVVAADVRLIDGNVLLDQSMLTGESIGTEAGPGFQTYAGALVRRGEAVGSVTATGTRTKFGRTAELIRGAHVVSTQQKAVLRVVRNLAMFNGGLIIILVSYALAHAMPVSEIIPLVLTAVLASIPVALPATFTLASALGARALAGQGVLTTRLSAVDEAASIDVLVVPFEPEKFLASFHVPDSDGLMRRQNRDAYSQSTYGNSGSPDARLRRSTHFGIGRARQLRRRAGPRGWRHSLRCLRESHF